MLTPPIIFSDELCELGGMKLSFLCKQSHSQIMSIIKCGMCKSGIASNCIAASAVCRGELLCLICRANVGARKFFIGKN